MPAPFVSALPAIAGPAAGAGEAMASGVPFLGEALKGLGGFMNTPQAGPALSRADGGQVNVVINPKPKDKWLEVGMWIAGGLLALKLLTENDD